MIDICFVIIILVLIWQLAICKVDADERCKELQSEWNKERQQLLDRIQAPSFAEYKQAEVKVIKAQKDEPPVERIELL